MMKQTVKRALLGWIAVLLAAGLFSPFAGASSFLGNEDKMKKDDQIRIFDKLWYKADADWMGFKKIYIAPVDTQHLEKMDWWEKSSAKGAETQKDLNELAYYMYSAVRKAQKQNKHKNRLIVVPKPGPDTIIMELALTKVVPTKAWLNTVSMVALFATVDQGEASFEGRIRDAETNEIIAKFADHEQGKANVVGNIKDFGWHGHAIAIIDEWARQLVDAVNWEEGQVLKDASDFELKIW